MNAMIPGQSRKGEEMADTDMLERRVEFMERDIIPRLTSAIDRMSESLQKLTAIDERQSEFKDAFRRAFNEIGDRKEEIHKLDERLRAAEIILPQLVMIKSWVIAGVLGMVGIFLVSAAVLIFKLPIH